MADRTPYPCKVITPDGVAFDGETQMVLVTGVGGDLGALANHAPLVADLRMGHVKVQLPDDSWRTWASREGFVKVNNSTALVLVEDAIETDKVDADAANAVIAAGKAELERAREQAQDIQKREDERYQTLDEDDEHDPFKADIEAAERRIAWGEHLLAMANGAQ